MPKKHKVVLSDSIVAELQKRAPPNIDRIMFQHLLNLKIVVNETRKLLDLFIESIQDAVKEHGFELKAKSQTCYRGCATCLSGKQDAHYPYFWTNPNFDLCGVKPTKKGEIKWRDMRKLLAGLGFDENFVETFFALKDYLAELINLYHTNVLTLRKAGLTKIKFEEELNFEGKEKTPSILAHN